MSNEQIITRTIWNRSDLEIALMNDELPKWCKESYSIFNIKLSDSLFPCTMGVSGHKKGTLVYSFASSPDNQKNLIHVGNVLQDYLSYVMKLPPEEAVMVVLILFFQPVQNLSTWDDYSDLAWSILQFLHDNDPKPWPDDIPTNPDNPLWSFCYTGVPIFVNVSMPAHIKRQSRNLGPGMCWVTNPRDAFDIIGSNTPKGKKLREQIRKKIVEYDEIPTSPDLSFYGDDDCREWKQYILLETNDPVSRRNCPLLITKRE